MQEMRPHMESDTETNTERASDDAQRPRNRQGTGRRYPRTRSSITRACSCRIDRRRAAAGRGALPVAPAGTRRGTARQLGTLATVRRRAARAQRRVSAGWAARTRRVRGGCRTAARAIRWPATGAGCAGQRCGARRFGGDDRAVPDAPVSRGPHAGRQRPDGRGDSRASAGAIAGPARCRDAGTTRDLARRPKWLAALAVADVPRRLATRRSRGQSQRAALRSPARVEAPSGRGGGDAVRHAPTVVDPFSGQQVRLPNRPWPRALLPAAPANGAFTVDYGSRMDIGVRALSPFAPRPHPRPAPGAAEPDAPEP